MSDDEGMEALGSEHIKETPKLVDASDDIMAEIWADKIEADINKLMNDNKMLKLTVLGAVGGVMLCGLGLGMAGTVMNKLIKSVTQLSEQNNAIVQVLGQGVGQAIIVEPTPDPPGPVDESLGVPQGNLVAEPFDQPEQHASEATIAAMEADRQNGMDPRALLEGRHTVQPTASPTDVPPDVKTPPGIGKTGQVS